MVIRLILIVAAAGLVVAVLSTNNLGYWCDGNFPAWVAERAHAGCVQTPALIEYLAPWHWGAEEVCIGLCTTLAG